MPIEALDSVAILPELQHGTVNYHGKIIAVTDISGQLGQEPCEGAFMIVLADQKTAFRVNSFEGFFTTDEEPQTAPFTSEIIRKIHQHNDRLYPEIEASVISHA
jgi:chemotaxis signal transduction protein